MRKIIKIGLSLVLILLCLGLFIRRDIAPVDNDEVKSDAMLNAFEYDLAEQKTVTIDGVDYLQTQVPVGKFGGKFVQSTIGEGPKTFNPWNSKDAFSSAVAGYMFEGLVTTSAYTGLAIPRLAKSFDILPDKKTYIIHLRKGLKWSDGKDLTADDVVYTWDTIIFGGFGINGGIIRIGVFRQINFRFGNMQERIRFSACFLTRFFCIKDIIRRRNNFGGKFRCGANGFKGTK